MFFEIRMKIKIGHFIYISNILYFEEKCRRNFVFPIIQNRIFQHRYEIYIFSDISYHIFISNANSRGIMHEVNGNINHKIIIRILKLIFPKETSWICLSNLLKKITFLLKYKSSIIIKIICINLLLLL